MNCIHTKQQNNNNTKFIDYVHLIKILEKYQSEELLPKDKDRIEGMVKRNWGYMLQKLKFNLPWPSVL